MIETIWKFELKTADEQTIEMPRHARILSLQVQNGILCLWAQVNPENAGVKRTFRIYGTGHPIIPVKNKVLHFVGTYQLANGAFVGHLFEAADY